MKRYNFFEEHSNGYSIVGTKTGFGVIKEIIPPSYEEVTILEGGFISARNNNTVFTFDIDGNRLHDTPVESHKVVQEEPHKVFRGIYIVKSEKGFGVIRQIVRPIYDNIRLRSEIIIVKKNYKEGVFNKQGKQLIKPTYESIYAWPDNIILCAKNTDESEEWILLTNNYTKVLRTIYSEILPCGNGFYIVKRRNKYGILDSNFKEIVLAEYNHIERYENNMFILSNMLRTRVITEGLRLRRILDYGIVYSIGNAYAAKNDKLYGLLDKQFNEILPPKYARIVKLTDNLIQLQADNYLYGYVFLQNGKISTYVPPEYTDVSLLTDKDSDDIPSLLKLKNKKNNKYALCSFDSPKPLTPFKYNYIIMKGKDIFVGVQKGKSLIARFTGLIDEKGNELIEPKYDAIKRCGDGFMVKKNDKWAIFDSHYNQITDFVYDDIHYVNEYNLQGKNMAEVVFKGKTGMYYW